MEQCLDVFLRDWKLDILEGEFRQDPENGDDVHIHLKTNEIWRPVKRLGSGASGQVWQQQCTQGESITELRAVKRINKTQAGFLKSSQRELQALATFSSHKKHQNRSKIDDQYEQRFVQFLGWYEDTNYLYFAMEFLECGDLQRFLELRSFIEKEEEAATIIQQVAEALQFMHTKDFIHGNLKPSNILVAKAGPAWHLKVAEFGIAKDFRGASVCTNYIGTHGYIAPEMIDSANYTAAVDVWALGAVAFRLRTGHPPFSTSDDLIQYRAGQKDFPSRVLGVSTGFCIDFILGAMRPLPETRLSVQQILNHEWLHMRETCRTLTAPSLSNKPLPTLSMVNRSTATSSAPSPNTQTNSTQTCITRNQSNPVDNLEVETRNGRVTGYDAKVVDQEQPRIKEEAEEREQQRVAAESMNRKASEGQNKRQMELSFFWKKKEEEKLKRQEELRRRQDIVKREEEAEEMGRQAKLERARKEKEELEQARAQQALLQQALLQQEQQQQQQQQQEREKRAREESEDAAEQEPKPDAERIKRVKKELKTICLLCGEKFRHRGLLSRHLDTYRHRMPKQYWGAGIGHTEFSDLDALEALRGPLG